ncbi:MAG: alpha/beta hydrolase family protein [Massilia sp.]
MIRLALRLALLAPLLSACSWANAAEPIPVASFFRDADVGFVKLSPTGRYVAVLNRLADGSQALVVRDTAEPKLVSTAASFDTARVLRVDWVNDNRLVFTLRNTNPMFEGNYDEFAVDRNGENLVHLIAGSWRHEQAKLGSSIKDMTLTSDYGFRSVAHDGSDDIIVERYTWNKIDPYPQSSHPFRLNTRSRRLTDMVPNGQPDFVTEWLFDPNDQARVGMASTKGRCIVYYRSDSKAPWGEISNRDCVKDGAFQPQWIDGQNTLYVKAGYQGRMALFTYDLNKKELAKEPMVDIEGFDFAGSMEVDYGSKKVVGIHFLADARSTAWLDPGIKAIQDKVNGLLPGSVNQIDCGQDCRDPQAVTVVASSDRMPPTYYIYRTAENRLVGLGSSNPAIDPKQMGKRDFFRFAARDGLQIPVYVTMPAAKAAPNQPRPAIVLVHGGPYVRGGGWEWDNEAQFLASRGYVVLQPEFRGSMGFGNKLFRAGWQQWGRTMQDDLADTAAWAVSKGWADSRRIGIMGASYGGYATLMGLVRDPNTFRAGVEWAGVTDISMMFSLVEADTSRDDRNYEMKTLIGDPLTDPAAFAEISPIEQATRVTQPLLMAHGGQDRRVPIAHAARFHSAVAAKNRNVEYVVYPEEGHGWRDEKNRLDFWQRVDKFLAKNLAQ